MKSDPPLHSPLSENQGPFFTVVVPTYNRAHLISATLQSVLDQDFPDFELLVVDDGSTDHTRDVVSACTDARVRYLPVTNGERGRARNLGTQQARGAYITFLDSDDLLLTHHLSTAHRLAQADCPAWICLSYAVDTDAQPRREVILSAAQLARLEQGNVLSCNGVLLRADIARAHPFVEDRRLAASEDWLLWLQLSARYAPAVSPVVTSVIIDHAQRSVRTDLGPQLRTRTELLVQHLRADAAFVAARGRAAVRRVHAHMLTYTALHMAMAGQRSQVLPLLLRAAALHPAELLQRRTLATLKHLIFAPRPAAA